MPTIENPLKPKLRAGSVRIIARNGTERDSSSDFVNKIYFSGMADSNCRPLAPEASALPAALIPETGICYIKFLILYNPYENWYKYTKRMYIYAKYKIH